MNLIKSNIFWWMVSICGVYVKSLLPWVKPRKRFEGTVRIDKLFINDDCIGRMDAGRKAVWEMSAGNNVRPYEGSA
jgi:hypothetical protein